MKILFIPFLILFASFNYLFAQQYVPVAESSEISFKIKNFGINVGGSFGGVNGEVIFAENNLAESKFNISVPTHTINTGINQRDNHLKKEEFFDVEQYPQMHFVSTKVTNSTNKEYFFVFGKLTIKDVTREVSFPFKATKNEGGYIFEGELGLNRRDYNVGGSSISMSDDVNIQLKLVTKKD